MAITKYSLTTNLYNKEWPFLSLFSTTTSIGTFNLQTATIGEPLALILLLNLLITDGVTVMAVDTVVLVAVGEMSNWMKGNRAAVV